MLRWQVAVESQALEQVEKPRASARQSLVEHCELWVQTSPSMRQSGSATVQSLEQTESAVAQAGAQSGSDAQLGSQNPSAAHFGHSGSTIAQALSQVPFWARQLGQSTSAGMQLAAQRPSAAQVAASLAAMNASMNARWVSMRTS